MIQFFLFAFMLSAQEFCPSLETVNFSANKCVPTTQDICHSGQPANCEVVRGDLFKCEYVRGAGVHLYHYPQDPGFNCVDRVQNCDEDGSENPNCTPGDCLKYSPPKCVQECKPCFQESRRQDQPIKGCVKFCNEPSCIDEPRCDPDPCPPGFPCNQNNPCKGIRIPGGPGEEPYIYPRNRDLEVCQSSTRCPTDPVTVPPEYANVECVYSNGSPCEFDSEGRVIPEISGPNECEVEPLEEDPSQPKNDSCPWIHYESRLNGGNGQSCQPVSIGNRFPQDCRECTGNPESKQCNIPPERCN